MLSTADNDIERLLKLFTFLSMEEIGDLMNTQWKDPSQRTAQHRLAYEFLCLAHGSESAQETAALHKSRANQRRSISLSELFSSSSPETKQLKITEEELANTITSDLLQCAGLTESKSEGKRLVATQGAYIGVPGRDGNSLEWQTISKSDNQQRGSATQQVVWKGDEGILVLRAGKMRVQHIRVTKSG
jgi:tyrosyl-tRNA synthetase